MLQVRSMLRCTTSRHTLVVMITLNSLLLAFLLRISSSFPLFLLTKLLTCEILPGFYNLKTHLRPNTLRRYSALKEVEHKSRLSQYGLSKVTSFQRVQYRKEEKQSKFKLEKPDKHYLGQMIRVNNNRDNSC